MKKKTKIIILIVLLLLVISLYKPIKEYITEARTPEKILVVGDRVDKYGVNFSKSIKDQEKIASFENIFNQVQFQDGWEGELDDSSLVCYIQHKEGTYSHWLDIWFYEDGALAVKSQMDQPEFCRLEKDQGEALRKIFFD